MKPRIEYEIIGAGAEEGGWNLYSPRYGDAFIGTFPTYAAALSRAVDEAHPDTEIAVIDPCADSALPRISIVPKGSDALTVLRDLFYAMEPPRSRKATAAWDAARRLLTGGAS